MEHAPPLESRLSLAERLHRLGLPRLAEQTLQRSAALAPGHPRVTRRLATLLLHEGEAERAHAIACGALAQADDAATHLVVADTARAAGRLAEAAGHYAEAQKRAGDDPSRAGRALVGAARVAAARGEEADALALTLKAAELAPLPVAVARRLGDVGGNLGAWRRLQQAVEARRRQQPEQAALHYLLARLLAAAQLRFEPGIPNQEIERLLRLALERDAGCHLARLMLALRQARQRYRDPDSRDKALGNLKFLSQALRLDEHALGVDAGLIDLLIAALLDEQARSAREAVDFYLAGLRRLPGHAVAATNLGVLYLGRGEASAARQRFLAALAASPDYEPAYHHLVRTLDLAASPEQIAHEVEALVATLSAPSTVVTGRIVAAMAEDARDQVFEALHAKATQLHTQLGVVHARLRALRERAPAAGGRDAQEQGLRLDELDLRLDELRQQWSQYLRSLYGTADSSPEVLNLNLVAGEVIRDESGQDGRVEFTPAPALPDIKGRRAALYEAVGAIVRNGLEAQPAASPPLQVRTLPIAPRSPRVALEVRDYGAGISALHRAQLFVPGFSTKRDRSGFGLSLARRIASAHRGWIVVEPAPQRGTVVRFVLPADLHGLPALLDEPLDWSEPPSP
jgi:signal transduction histidine kinase